MADETGALVAARAPRSSYLGWRAERRPRPGFAHVLGAVAGAFATIATVAFVVAATDDDPQTPGIAFSLVLVAVALAVGVRGPGPIRSAGTTALVFAVPLLWGFALVGDGTTSSSDIRAILLLSVASYAALYALGWTKGRLVFLAAALIVFAYWAAFEISGAGSSSSLFTGSFTTVTNTPSVGGDADAANATLLVIGLVYLVTGGLLDRRRLAGTATPLLVVGAVAAIIGGVSLAATESTLAAGIVAALIGAAVGLIAAAGHERRGTTWLGVLAVFGGLVAILTDVAPDDEWGVGAIALAIALVSGVVAWLLAGVLGEPDDGDDRPPAPTAPEGGTTMEAPPTLAGEAAA